MSGPRENHHQHQHQHQHQHHPQSHFSPGSAASNLTGTAATVPSQPLGLGQPRALGPSNFPYEQQQHKSYEHGHQEFQSQSQFVTQSAVNQYAPSVGMTTYGIPSQSETVSHSSISHGSVHSGQHNQQHHPHHISAEQSAYSQHGNIRSHAADRYSDTFPSWKTEPEDSTPSAPLSHNVPANQQAWALETGVGRAVKRTRPEVAEADAHQDTAEDEVKRARGRPRLQTTDQTASERRRTQIRLAQRAYRSRKETAMNDLEGQVKKLKDDNIEMQEAVRDLADCVAQYSSLISKIPELARHLNKIRALVKTRKNSTRSDDSCSDDVLERNTQDNPEPLIKSENSKDYYSPAMKTDGQAQHLAGVNVPANYDGRENHGYSAYQSHDGSEYEVIAVPTSDNASFVPNKIDLGVNFLQGMPWTGQPQLNTFQLSQSGPPPASAFGKRLHRHAKAKTAALFNTTSWPTDSILHVFGLSLFFESAHDIQRRINEDLQPGTNEALYDMQLPYYANSATAAQYMDRNQLDQVNGPANSYTGDENYRSRPPITKIAELRGKLLDICKAMQIPSMRSVVWDCDEVDSYLTQRGVALSSTVEMCNVEIDPAAFPIQHSDAQQQQESAHMINNATSNGSHGNEPFNEANWGNGGPLPPEAAPSAGQVRKVVRVNVVKLLDDLASQGICIGRIICFRPGDVNAAFWGAVST